MIEGVPIAAARFFVRCGCATVGLCLAVAGVTTLLFGHQFVGGLLTAFGLGWAGHMLYKLFTD